MLTEYQTGVLSPQPATVTGWLNKALMCVTPAGQGVSSRRLIRAIPLLTLFRQKTSNVRKRIPAIPPSILRPKDKQGQVDVCHSVARYGWIILASQKAIRDYHVRTYHPIYGLTGRQEHRG